MKVNKFDSHWQALRTSLKKVKDPSKKVLLTLKFLDSHPTKENRERVRNFLAMTKVAYKDPEVRKHFDDGLDTLLPVDQYEDETERSGPEVLSDNDLVAVYKDLSKRKYNFQFKKVPQDHIDYMEELENELDRRDLSV